MKLFETLYRIALLALPAPVRRRDGEELRRLFHDVQADVERRRGPSAARARALREVADLVATGAGLRWWRLVESSPKRARAALPSAAQPRPGEPMRSLLHDLRLAARALTRRPGFTAITVFTLALGIGASTSIFAVVDHVLLRPLPYPDSERLVMVWRVVERFGFDRAPVSYPDFADWRAASGSFRHLAAFTGAQATLLGEGDPALLRGARVTGDLFAALGRGPLLGRLVEPADDDPGAAPVVVLSEGLWRARFGADPGILGRILRLDDQAVRVIGVLPGDVDFPSPDTAFWLPLRLTAATAERDMNFLHVLGRLAPGVPAERAEREIRAAAERVAAEHPGENETDGVWIESRHAFLVGDVRPILLVLLGAVATLLALACANVANLLLARSVERRRELAVRAALGAGTARLGTAVLAESLLLALSGGGLAVILALAATRALVAFDPAGLPRLEEIAVDGRIALACAAVSLVCGLLCGLVPLFGGAHRVPARALGEGLRSTGDLRSGRLQSGLVVAQVALATLLLVGAGLLAHSFYRLVSVAPGFRGERVLTARVSPSPAAYPEAGDIDRFYSELTERLRALPGAEGVGGTWALPFSHVPASWGGPTSAASSYAPAEALEPTATTTVELEPIRGDYFPTLGMTLLAGRSFTDADRAGAPPVAIVNETLARRFWSAGGAVGRRMVKPGSPDSELTVVGVVADVKRRGLDQAAEPVAYLPHPQALWSHSLFLTLRTAGDPEGMARALREEVWAIDPAAAVTGVAVLSDLVSGSVAGPRLRTAVLTAVAGTAGALALVGVYGVISFAVAGRTRELAVRLALGAGRRRVLEEVLARGLALVGLGLLLGGAGAAAATRALRSFLFEVPPLDPLTFVAVPAALLAAGALACWAPAKRAARTDPAAALREG